MFETVAVDNVNSWISGGSALGVLTSLNWCRIKIKSQCAIITELKKEMKSKVDEKTFDKFDRKNDSAHGRIFDQINTLPARIKAEMK